MKALSNVVLFSLFSILSIQDENTTASPECMGGLECQSLSRYAFETESISDINKNEENVSKRKALTSGSMNFLNNLFSNEVIRKYKHVISSRVKAESLCITCKALIGYINLRIKDDVRDDFPLIFTTACSMFQTSYICEEYYYLYEDHIMTIATNMNMTAEETCAVLLPGCGAVSPRHNWTVPLTSIPKPPVIIPPPPESGYPVLRALHITDVHVDFLFKEGSNANCDEPLCCRATSGTPATSSDAAGYWGDENCGIPLRTLDEILDHINKTHKIDYVIFTGDIPPHNSWSITKPEALVYLYVVSSVIDKYFGHLPIFPAIGNHESAPSDSFSIPQITGSYSNSWLYNEVENIWSKWLPEYQPTVKLGAYYSVLVQPGLRVISLNMNYCYMLNWWLLLNTTDPAGQLAWLVQELQMAELKEEKVHIIGHIPPGTLDCLSVWGENYNKIINRFENTITGQFFGHNHKDEFEVFYDSSGPKPRATNVAYIAPILTTYSGGYPAYRIYTVDGNYPGSSRVILDHETYYMNLPRSNELKKAEFMFGYSAKEDFNMESLLPSEWDALIKKFETDDKLFQKFYRFYRSLSRRSLEHCDSVCKDVLLRRLRTSRRTEFSLRDEIEKLNII